MSPTLAFTLIVTSPRFLDSQQPQIHPKSIPTQLNNITHNNARFLSCLLLLRHLLRSFHRTLRPAAFRTRGRTVLSCLCLAPRCQRFVHPPEDHECYLESPHRRKHYSPGSGESGQGAEAAIVPAEREPCEFDSLRDQRSRGDPSSSAVPERQPVPRQSRRAVMQFLGYEGVDVSCLVDIGGGKDLAMVLVKGVDKLSVD